MDKIVAIILNLKSALISRLRTYLTKKWKGDIFVNSISYVGMLYLYIIYIGEPLSSLLKRLEEHFILSAASYLGGKVLLMIIPFLIKVLITGLYAVPIILLKYIVPLFVSFLNSLIILVKQTFFLPVQLCKYVMDHPKLVSSFATALLCIFLSKDTFNTNMGELGQRDVNSSVNNRAILETPKIPLPSVASAPQPLAVPRIETPITLPQTEPVPEPLAVPKVDIPSTLPRVEPVPQPLAVSKIEPPITLPRVGPVLQPLAVPKINISSALAGMDSALQPFTIPKSNVLDTLPSIASFNAGAGVNFQSFTVAKNSAFDTPLNIGLSTNLAGVNPALQASPLLKGNILDTLPSTGISTTLAGVNLAGQAFTIPKNNVLNTPPSIATFNAASGVNFQSFTIPKSNILDTLPNTGISSTLPRTD